MPASNQSSQNLFYHGSFRRIKKFNPLTHFGTIQASSNRLDEIWGSGDPSHVCENVRIYEVTLDIRNPLTIIDSWTDLPIGRAGEELFKEFPKAQPEEIRHVLEPYVWLSVPRVAGSFQFAAEHVCETISVARLEKEIIHDGVASLPLKPDAKRFPYCQEDYEYILRLSAVSARFAKLAKNYGYDGLVYDNTNESRGRESYINFSSEQVQPTGRVFTYASLEDYNLGTEALERGQRGLPQVAGHFLKKISL